MAQTEARLGNALHDGEASGAAAADGVGRATNETARRVCLCSLPCIVGPIEWWSGVGVGARRFTEHAQLMAALGSAGRDDNKVDMLYWTRASHAAATAVSSMGAGDEQMDLELRL
uniref:Uncharacterized protein n=1 Tax=Oryza glumipatula TaxID=40148 RepID=A0A0D9ZDA5_9ORYZ